jgi:hypothetical protein
MRFELWLITLLGKYLIVAIPFTVLALRLLVRWIAREQPREVFRSIITPPTDLMFISMSLVLTGLARLQPKFAHNYGSDRNADLAGAILLVVLVFIASLLTYFGRGVRLLWQKSYAAWQQIVDRRQEAEEKQQAFDWRDNGIAFRLFWLLGYWVMMIILVSIQLLVSVGALEYILRLMR